MKILINTADLISNIKSKSHGEVSSIEDEKLRYKVEAGSEKESEIRTCINEAYASFESGMFRFIVPSCEEEGFATNGLPENLEFFLVGNQRRFAGKLKTIADILFSLLTNLTLCRFYASVNHAELSARRNELAVADSTLLEKLMFEKRPPRV